MVLADLIASSMNSDATLQTKISAIYILCSVPQKLMTACMEPVRLVYLLFYHVMLGNPRLSSILDSSLWDSGLILSGTWIRDSNCYLESAVLQLYSGFQSPGDQIPRAKISRIPESALRGTTSTKKKQPFQTSLQSQEGGTVNTFQIEVTIVNLFCC